MKNLLVSQHVFADDENLIFKGLDRYPGWSRVWHAILGPAAADLNGVELLALTDHELSKYCGFKEKKAPG